MVSIYEKKNGEKVFAGTINQKGSFHFTADKVGGDTILAQIIKMVQEAQGSKAPVQKLVDKIAGIFVPIVILIAILSFITWIIVGGENGLTHGMLALVTVLVIACPCALGLATPTAIMAGVGKGAENGILIKDAESLELAKKVNAIILDKTGTITEGRPVVIDTIDLSLENTATRWLSQANTVIYFADGKQTLAIIAIADKIKQTSIEAVSQLQAAGIEVYMLTGDNPSTAKAIAEQVGIKNYRAEVLPAHKADFVKELQQQGKVVAMVGDGINDSNALAQADVSIAMGKGSDIAMDVAKMTIISSDLSKIPQAIKLSKHTVATIKQNLFWAFIYNIIGIPIAAGILYPFNGFLLNPMIAGAAMALSSISVVSNSLRLKALKL